MPNGGRGIPDVRLSDHSPFWDQGYDALMVTDTSFMRNPHYHQMSDTVETLDLPFFCGVVEGLAEALGSAKHGGRTPIRRDTRPTMQLAHKPQYWQPFRALKTS